MIATDHCSQLTDLVAHAYNLPDVTFAPVHAYNDEWRKVCRIEDATGSSWLIRALRHEDDLIPTQLQNAATILPFLERVGYKAPRVRQTVTGNPIATYADWSALLLSYIHGVSSDYTAVGLRGLGAALAMLHCAHMDGSDATAQPTSRWMLHTLLPWAMARLDAVAAIVPDSVTSLYQAWRDLYRRMQDWADLPLTLIHGDCWPANAVRVPSGEVVLIDWDNAGIGLPVLDLGYLIVACHLSKPQLPIIYPDADAVTAVLEGYCQYRVLTTVERAYIPDAVRFGIAYLGTRHLSEAIQRGVDDDLFMQKIRARWAAAGGIIEIACDYLKQNRS